MVRRLKPAILLAAIACVLCTRADAAEDSRRSPFVGAQVDGGRLQHVRSVPILVVEGTPEEMGRRQAQLVGKTSKPLLGYPMAFLIGTGRLSQWDQFLEATDRVAEHLAPHHRKEMDAFCEESGISRRDMVNANMLVDVYRGGFGCSSIMAEPSRSATDGPLFGRNLDFPGFGTLERFSLVVIYRPTGKHAFASIGWPGLLGSLSGMNDAGLALAVHEVYATADRAPAFAPGEPFCYLFRRCLEECETVGEVEKLLEEAKRTAMFSLAVCDRDKAVVFECTPKNVVRRNAVSGVCACTNHFRTPSLRRSLSCGRYEILRRPHRGTFTAQDIHSRMSQVASPRITLQTMIFEPRSLRLHVGLGSCPATSCPLVAIDLKPLFEGDATTADR